MPDAQEEEPEDDFEDGDLEEEEEDDEEPVEEEYSDEDFETPKPSSKQSRKVGALEAETPTVRRKPITFTTHTPIKLARGGGIKARDTDNENKLRTRGIADFDKVGGHEQRLKSLFGPENKDLKPILMSRDYWGPQDTFPIRKPTTVHQDDPNAPKAPKAPFPGSLRRSFFESDEAREKESTALRRWYEELGKEAFSKTQKTRGLSKEEAKVYMSTSGPETVNVLWGPVNDPKIHTLSTRSSMQIAEAFGGDQSRRGWLFNLGSRVQEAQWTINEESRTQYLAVAVEQKPTSGHQPKHMEAPKAPAFTATEPFPASIQVWAFEGTKDGELDTSQEPRLVLVICTDWGAPKQLRWCPVEATDGQKDSEDGCNVHIGLLAGIWSDGRARILDLSTPGNKDDTTYLHYSCAAFEISLPHTIPSCLHWMSGTTLAVATAAGTVGIWTLTRPGTLAPPNANDFNPRPWFYKQLADTYILTIVSGWPSKPQFLSITTADGFARLCDVRSPDADATASIRGRGLYLSQSWHEQTQSFAMPDEHYMLKHTPARRYYHGLLTMRLEGSISRIATSLVHPGILAGGVDGTVEATNPISRITNYKINPWQHKWFVHEWRGPIENMLVRPRVTEDVAMVEGGPVQQPDDGSVPTAQDDGAHSSTESNGVPQSMLSQPLIRITEGYKPTQTGIVHNGFKKSNKVEVGIGITVYEEQSAITALVWNPNLKFGTWAVAGTASGLLRVEDVGITAKE
jgi:transcription factor C subunit 6